MAPKTAVITGITSGLGLATANLLVTEGWDVIGTTRNADLVIEGLDSRVEIVALDVTDSQSITRFADHVRNSTSRIDLLVNNAGYFHLGPIEASSMDEIRQQFETNFFGLIEVTKQFLPQFRTQRSGTIINIASTSALNGYPFIGAYAASKAAVLSLSESMNIEMAPLGVTVKAVLPGAHATKIFTKIDIASGIPEEYFPGLRTFFGHQKSLRGSDPTVAARQVVRAATDDKRDKVRYFAGPDATPIPTMQRLMGAGRYFRFMKNLANKGPGPIMRRLTPEGDSEVAVSDELLALIADPEDAGR